MFDFILTALAVAAGVVLAVLVFDGTQYILAEMRAHKARKAEIREAQRLEDLRLRNRRLRRDFIQDGWLPPTGWDIDENGDWTPVDMDVTLAGRRHPAKAPEERLEELREEQDSYW
jgi:heme exporter protein D